MDDIDEMCPHGMNPEWCASCKYGPPTEEPARAIWTFTASYDGHCPSCDLPIVPGQRISRWTDECYRHAGCQP